MSSDVTTQVTTKHTGVPGAPPIRVRGLDGLRAIAAGIVLIFHLIPGLGALGFVGVDVFFVISGFLITGLLMKEHATTGRVALGKFWVRRLRRLVPAIVVATVSTTALARVVGGDALVQLGWQTFGSLTGTYNWFQVANASSYFDRSSPKLLTNMWSLGVEQQFYLVWPIIVFALLAFGLRRKAGMPRWLPFVSLALAAVSLTLHLRFLGDDPTRSYVGTDTHAFGLMLGATLALALPGILYAPRPSASPIWGYFAWPSLVALVILGVFAPENNYMYPWGMLGFSVLAFFIIRGILPDASGRASDSLRSFLEHPLLVWLGHRSYGIYLWHWPLYVIAYYHSPYPPAANALLVLTASIIAAALSFRYVETPIRQQGFGTWTLRIMNRHSFIYTTFVGMLAGAVASFSFYAVYTERPHSSAEEIILAAQASLAELQASGDDAAAAATEETDSSDSATEEPATEPAPPSIEGTNVTIIGDSVTLASAPALAETFPGATVDAAVSRSFEALPELAQSYVDAGTLGDYVVIGLGNNSEIYADTVARVQEIIGPDRYVVLITGHAPGAWWVDSANATIFELAAENPDRVRVADWFSIAQAHPELLAGDQIHPGVEGGQLYAAEVLRALESFAEASP
ncbi:MAG: acetyltransferase [Actinomycetaceae bacterium]|nr:acetyltransferase [Actinomycetaceae bacterium]